MRRHLGPLGIRQAHAIHENPLSELDSQTAQPVNPNSQHSLVGRSGGQADGRRGQAAGLGQAG
jgi:hypothetical protein